MPGPFNKYGIQRLGRDAHIAQCYDMLEDFPAGFVVMDASRPWMIYWGLCSLFLLGEDITKLRRRVVATLAAVQNPKGGFAGGHGQTSHAAPSYASLMCLALVGGDDAYDMIDRTALWHWAASLKQRDGGFSMAVGGEEDVRGAYCIMSCIALLNLPLELPENCKARQEYGYEKFTDGLAEYISR
ncbi:CAAX farnesyltransferase (FTase) subunit beta, partial [Ascosphaera atra]